MLNRYAVCNAIEEFTHSKSKTSVYRANLFINKGIKEQNDRRRRTPVNFAYFGR